MRNIYQIYLCGGMQKYGKENFDKCNMWRKYCKQTLESYEGMYRICAINPNDYFSFNTDSPQYASQKEVLNFDLHKLRNSNLVIANFNDMYSLGSMAEIAIAYDRGIPVIGLNESGQELHSWQVCMCERIFTDIDEMLDYIEDFYLR